MVEHCSVLIQRIVIQELCISIRDEGAVASDAGAAG